MQKYNPQISERREKNGTVIGTEKGDGVVMKPLRSHFQANR